MALEGWLDPSLVRLRVSPASIEALVAEVSLSFAEVTGEDVDQIRSALLDAMHGEGFSLGRGVAVPHVELPNLTETRVCLVTLAARLPIPAIDGHPVDVLFFILSKPDPQSHLLLLAHLARLAQSRTFLDGLRRVDHVDGALALVAAAEKRHQVGTGVAIERVSVAPEVTDTLVLISLSGEQAVDALLVDLVGLGLPDACIIEAQSLREAASREVPLFAGFRDLFGDPGGRRIFLLEAPAKRTDETVAAVERVCQEHQTANAQLSVIPLRARWSTPTARPDPRRRRS